MSAREYIDSSEEEEQMVARVGGRGRSLEQALMRVRRERAGGPSKFARDPGYWNETTDTGTGSTWSGSGEETRRTLGKGEMK